MEVVWILLGILIGGGALFAMMHFSGRNLILQGRAEAETLKRTAQLEADTKAKEIELAAQKKLLTIKEAAEAEQSVARRKLDEQEARIERRETTLENKLNTLSVKERNLDDLDAKLAKQKNAIADKEREIDELRSQEREKLLNITSLSPDQAKEILLHRIEDECRGEVGEIVQRHVTAAEEEGRDKARQIILQAIQRYASDQTADHTVSSVSIPDDAMKGRVIGREGRNIRAFEKTTGVDVIIDDTPGLVTVSCFDPVRREIARITLERLVQDGRIHPARVEEVFNLVTKEMDENLIKLGKDAAAEAHLPNLPRGIIPLLGRLAFRTSYGQNVLKHSLEVAYLSQVIAAELGLNSEIARRAGLLHDIGKAMDHEQEGGHPLIGMEFLKKFNESEAVLNAAWGHHGDVQATTPYTPIVMAADAISASRPGARRESLERYIKRLQDLEEVCTGFDGVRQAYAIQAGREVRVICDAKMLDDRNSAKLARDIAKKVQTDLTYPGEIKVTVLREVRSVEYAR
ncbi:MAG TPA: ribonuclease Y [Tepidisphaeraceae bacterium]|jgi:ribonuclease Y